MGYILLCVFSKYISLQPTSQANGFFRNQIISLLHSVPFFNTASGVCQSLRVQLFNDAFEAQWERQGIYHISALVNGQPSWTTPYSGIWYMPELRRWKIGPIESIGLNCEGLESVELGSKLYYPENIHFTCKDWNYHTMDGWVPANEHNYILVEKRGKNILDHLDIPVYATVGGIAHGCFQLLFKKL